MSREQTVMYIIFPFAFKKGYTVQGSIQQHYRAVFNSDIDCTFVSVDLGPRKNYTKNGRGVLDNSLIATG